ncbi:hypothetical protein DID88_007276 [Monilinia fructigena]|uniref:SNF2 N-terminal domain-containing protein n=1 Tax=Monilinia fructigena TaxID=38457 RepID=A0A395J7X5_9HELO|nr:hypothetical protein DID88_007276 [Monilinia fructigena]
MAMSNVPGAYVEDPSTASDSDVEIIDSTFPLSRIMVDKKNKALKRWRTQMVIIKAILFTGDPRLGETAVSRTNTSLQNSQYGSNHTLPAWPANSANEMKNTDWIGGSNNVNKNSALPMWARRTTWNHSSQMSTAQQGYSMDGTSSGHSVYNTADEYGTNGFPHPKSPIVLESPLYPLPGSYGGSIHAAPPGTSMHNADLGYTVDNVPSYGMRMDYSNSLQRGVAGNMSNLPDFAQSFNTYRPPTQLTTEMRGIGWMITSKADIEIPLEDREGTPEGLKYPLYEHQKIALTWLKQMEEGTNKGARAISRPFMQAAPVALLRQWQSEIKTKVLSNYRPSVYMAHGNSKKVTWDELQQYDVVLTTYGTLGAEYTRLLKFEEDCKQKGILDPDAKEMAKDFPFLGPKSRFYRVILDEAQCIKNKSTKAASSACKLKALTRFCLTVSAYSTLSHLVCLFKRFRLSLKGKSPLRRACLKNTMKRLQGVLKAILLRRTKKSQIDGKPIINLPPKVEEIAHVVFSNDEQEFYQSLENKTQLQFNKYKKAGTVGKNYSNILVLLLSP